MQLPSEFHLQQIVRYSNEIGKLRSKLLVVSVLRLASFLLFGGSVYLLITHDAPQYRFFVIFSVILFFLLLRYFSTYKAAKKFAEQLLFINQNEKDVTEGKHSAFEDDTDLPCVAIYADDLDLYGEGSLFHYLNRTTTTHGSAWLVKMLENPHLAKNDIENSQSAIQALAKQPEKMQRIIARGLSESIEGENVKSVNSWLNTRSALLNRSWLKIVRYVLPLTTIVSFLYYLDSDNPIPFGIAVVLSWLIVGSFASYISGQHAHIGKKQSVLQQYASILKQFMDVDDEGSTLLQRLKRTADAGNIAIARLSQLTSLFDQRLNLLVNVFLNSFLLYDIQCMILLERWKEKHRDDFNSWTDAVGEIELVVSLGTFSFNHPEYQFPLVQEGAPYIKAEKLAHPLIRAGESVSNDVEAGRREKLLLITGSNMSGKSTFLRTIGTNLLLAQCGAPVCATSFTFTPMKILSSIRITDSLQEHTSYFMAELKRLRQIIDVLELNQPSLVLIDEVLRGTNSSDKTHGSEALIRKLIKAPALTFFASHDLSLSALEGALSGSLSNYCFESTIADGELLFDYKLQQGVARNKNATFLMQKMGIIS